MPLWSKLSVPLFVLVVTIQWSSMHLFTVPKVNLKIGHHAFSYSFIPCHLKQHQFIQASGVRSVVSQQQCCPALKIVHHYDKLHTGTEISVVCAYKLTLFSIQMSRFSLNWQQVGLSVIFWLTQLNSPTLNISGRVGECCTFLIYQLHYSQLCVEITKFC